MNNNKGFDRVKRISAGGRHQDSRKTARYVLLHFICTMTLSLKTDEYRTAFKRSHTNGYKHFTPCMNEFKTAIGCPFGKLYGYSNSDSDVDSFVPASTSSVLSGIPAPAIELSRLKSFCQRRQSPAFVGMSVFPLSVVINDNFLLSLMISITILYVGLSVQLSISRHCGRQIIFGVVV